MKYIDIRLQNATLIIRPYNINFMVTHLYDVI